jgi:hypothetical protein
MKCVGRDDAIETLHQNPAVRREFEADRIACRQRWASSDRRPALPIVQVTRLRGPVGNGGASSALSRRRENEARRSSSHFLSSGQATCVSGARFLILRDKGSRRRRRAAAIIFAHLKVYARWLAADVSRVILVRQHCGPSGVVARFGRVECREEGAGELAGPDEHERIEHSCAPSTTAACL